MWRHCFLWRFRYFESNAFIIECHINYCSASLLGFKNKKTEQVKIVSKLISDRIWHFVLSIWLGSRNIKMRADYFLKNVIALWLSFKVQMILGNLKFIYKPCSAFHVTLWSNLLQKQLLIHYRIYLFIEDTERKFLFLHLCDSLISYQSLAHLPAPFQVRQHFDIYHNDTYFVHTCAFSTKCQVLHNQYLLFRPDRTFPILPSID